MMIFKHCLKSWAVVVGQLVARSLPTPEVRSSNSVIGEIFINLFNINCIEKTKIKKIEAGNYPFFKSDIEDIFNGKLVSTEA